MSEAEKVFNEAFSKVRDPGSSEYKLGVLVCLQVRLDGTVGVSCPYPQGTAEADAFWSGVEDGKALSPKRVPLPEGADVPVTMTL